MSARPLPLGAVAIGFALAVAAVAVLVGAGLAAGAWWAVAVGQVHADLPVGLPRGGARECRNR